MTDTKTISAPADQSQAMDQMYRLTRHVYDLSRKYYLLGRDQLLDQMAPALQPGDRVLEIGCGTARNLVGLARRNPKVELYGLDASRQMLETAEKNLRKSGLLGRIVLRPELAENLRHETTFDLREPFDALFFSYSLSIIPTWPLALEAGLANLKSGGTLYIVDFWDQGDLPAWFGKMLRGWLKKFHVAHRPELLTQLRAWEEKDLGTLTVQSVARRYAYIAKFQKK
ncbi:MAG: hypothetical protein B9S32_15340 [Verrucomicrobia bacterium Tous-C9LFEB]|nr:MAG: hypothetical protein B9S32_15340 [Verrucomicrobia bacterium Tous-C9LFEB]